MPMPVRRRCSSGSNGSSGQVAMAERRLIAPRSSPRAAEQRRIGPRRLRRQRRPRPGLHLRERAPRSAPSARRPRLRAHRASRRRRRLRRVRRRRPLRLRPPPHQPPPTSPRATSSPRRGVTGSCRRCPGALAPASLEVGSAGSKADGPSSPCPMASTVTGVKRCAVRLRRRWLPTSGYPSRFASSSRAHRRRRARVRPRASQRTTTSTSTTSETLGRQR